MRVSRLTLLLPVLLTLLSLLLHVPRSALAQPAPVRSLITFRSDAELSRYLRALGSASQDLPASSYEPPVPWKMIHSAGRMFPGRAALITGRITDFTGRPLAGAMVTVPRLSALTDAAGTFSIAIPEGALPASRSVTVTVQRHGYEGAVHAVGVRQGDSLHLEVWLAAREPQLQREVASAASAAGPVESSGIAQRERAGEAGIVKLHGTHLVILRRGRLHTIALGERTMRPVAEHDVIPPGIDGASYHELHVYADQVIVVGTSNASGGTEIVRFRIDRSGGLRHIATHHIRANGGDVARTYGSRLLDGKLVLYTPLRTPLYGEDPLEALPALRQWHGTADSPEFERIVTPGRVYATSRALSRARPTALHAITSCDLRTEPFACEGSVVVGPPGQTYHVSPRAVYVWANEPEWQRDANADALVLRIPLDGSSPGVVRATGAAVDQFAFSEDADHLNVVVVPPVSRPWLWTTTHEQVELALARIPLRSFGDGSWRVPRSSYRPLPVPAHGEVRSRFVNGYLVYAVQPWDADEVPGRIIGVAPLHGGPVVQLLTRHDVSRIEPMGSDAVVIGERAPLLHLTTIHLGGMPRVGPRLTLGDTTPTLWSMDGVFHAADGPSRGTLGIGVQYSGSERVMGLINGSAKVRFLRHDGNSFLEVGQLELKTHLVDDACQATCIEWTRHPRAIFVQGRVFALLGPELVEGAMRNGRLVETRRVTFARERASPAQILAAREETALRRLVAREATGRELGARDSVLQHYSQDLTLFGPSGPALGYYHMAREVDSLRARVAGAPVRVDPVIEEVTVTGDMAVMRVTWMTTAGQGIEQRQSTVRELRVWRRDPEAGWRFVRGARQAAVIVR